MNKIALLVILFMVVGIIGGMLLNSIWFIYTINLNSKFENLEGEMIPIMNSIFYLNTFTLDNHTVKDVFEEDCNKLILKRRKFIVYMRWNPNMTSNKGFLTQMKTLFVYHKLLEMKKDLKKQYCDLCDRMSIPRRLYQSVFEVRTVYFHHPEFVNYQEVMI